MSCIHAQNVSMRTVEEAFMNHNQRKNTFMYADGKDTYLPRERRKVALEVSRASTLKYMKDQSTYTSVLKWHSNHYDLLFESLSEVGQTV